MTSHTKAADLLLALVALIWGGGFTAGKIALEGFSPLAVVSLRFCGSAAIFALLFHRNIRAARRKACSVGILIGCVQFASLFIQMTALQYTTPMKQSFLAATYVVFTPFLARVLSAKPLKGTDVAAAVLALTGVGLISITDQFTVRFGDALTLGFSLLFSVQIVLIEKLAHALDCFAVTFFQFLTAGILSLLAAAAAGTSFKPGSAAAVGGIVYIIVLNTAVATGLQNFAQRRANPNHAALILSMESVFGFLISALVYRTPVTPRMLTGCALVFAAVMGSQFLKSRDKARKASTR